MFSLKKLCTLVFLQEEIDHFSAPLPLELQRYIFEVCREGYMEKLGLCYITIRRYKARDLGAILWTLHPNDTTYFHILGDFSKYPNKATAIDGISYLHLDDRYIYCEVTGDGDDTETIFFTLKEPIVARMDIFSHLRHPYDPCNDPSTTFPGRPYLLKASLPESLLLYLKEEILVEIWV